MFVPYGRGVFAEPQRGSAPSADGGDVAAPAAVGKRVDTYGFYPLNSRFPLFLSLAKIGERRPLRNRGTAEDFFYCRGAQRAPISLPLRSVGYIAAKHAGNSPQGRTLCVFFLFCTNKTTCLWPFSTNRGTPNFVKKRLCGKICFRYNKYVKTTAYIGFCVFHQQNRMNRNEAD